MRVPFHQCLERHSLHGQPLLRRPSLGQLAAKVPMPWRQSLREWKVPSSRNSLRLRQGVELRAIPMHLPRWTLGEGLRVRGHPGVWRGEGKEPSQWRMPPSVRRGTAVGAGERGVRGCLLPRWPKVEWVLLCGHRLSSQLLLQWHRVRVVDGWLQALANMEWARLHFPLGPLPAKNLLEWVRLLGRG